MAETVSEAQFRLTIELQDILRISHPTQDWSVGTVNYELIIKPLAAVFAEREGELTTLREQMSLAQVLSSDDPDDTLVDNLLSNFGVVRSEGSPGTGLINVFINSSQPVTIPATTTITCGGVEINPVKTFVGTPGTITPQDTENVAYVQAVQFDDNTWVFSITAETVDSLSTVLAASTTCTFNLASPFISKMQIGSTFTGGSGAETNEELFNRAQTNINAKVTTGRANIKSLLATNEVVDVDDVAVFGFGDEEMLRDSDNSASLSKGGHVDIYVKTAPVPSTAVAVLPGTKTDDVWSIVIPQDTYAGAYGVLGVTFEGNLLNANLTHVLGFTTDTTAPEMSEPIHARYSQYQTLTITFPDDICAPFTTLTEADFLVDILFMPGLTSLQAFMQGVDIRSYSFDTLIKAVIPVIVTANISIEYEQGLLPPTAEEIAQAVSDAINLEPIYSTTLYSSTLIAAVNNIFPSGDVQMPVNMFGRIFLPNGTEAYATNDNYLQVQDGLGVSSQNSTFFSFPSGIQVTLTELTI